MKGGHSGTGSLDQRAPKERILGAEEAVDSREQAEEAARLVVIVVSRFAKQQCDLASIDRMCADDAEPADREIRQLCPRHQFDFVAVMTTRNGENRRRQADQITERAREDDQNSCRHDSSLPQAPQYVVEFGLEQGLANQIGSGKLRLG